MRYNMFVQQDGAAYGSLLCSVCNKNVTFELEHHADLCLPGWRDQAEVVRYLPNLTVTHATAAPAGQPAR